LWALAPSCRACWRQPPTPHNPRTRRSPSPPATRWRL
jgi:hypothetical protein